MKVEIRTRNEFRFALTGLLSFLLRREMEVLSYKCFMVETWQKLYLDFN